METTDSSESSYEVEPLNLFGFLERLAVCSTCALSPLSVQMSPSLLFSLDFFWGLLFLGDDGHVLLRDSYTEGHVSMLLTLVASLLDLPLAGLSLSWVSPSMTGLVFPDFNSDIIRDRRSFSSKRTSSCSARCA